MSAVCLVFHLHQPYQLTQYDFLQIGTAQAYFDQVATGQAIQQAVQQCYLPANKRLEEAIYKHKGRLNVAFSISGTVLELFEQYAPIVLDSFRRLINTGAVELLGTTYHHTPLLSGEELAQEVMRHSAKIQQIFKVKPLIFNHYGYQVSYDMLEMLKRQGFRGIISDAYPHLLEGRTENALYQTFGNLSAIFRHRRLSEDIALHFKEHSRKEIALSATIYANWVMQLAADNQLVTLGIDYETFGSRQAEQTGIMEFLSLLPEKLLAKSSLHFFTPSALLAQFQPYGMLAFDNVVPHYQGFDSLPMAQEAFQKVYHLLPKVTAKKDKALYETWLKLASIAHFWQMSTAAYHQPDAVTYPHAHASPFEMFVNYMNIVADLEERI